MSERELLELAAAARQYIGQAKLWTPSYPGARPIRCVGFSCAVNASFTSEGMNAAIPMIWTHYMERGREETVWFTRTEWDAMPAAETEESATPHERIGKEE